MPGPAPDPEETRKALIGLAAFFVVILLMNVLWFYVREETPPFGWGDQLTLIVLVTAIAWFVLRFKPRR